MNQLLRAANIRHSALARRLASGTAANLLGKLWIVLQQIVSIPLLTGYWGVEGYGLWLLVSTVPAYILVADFGLAPTLGVSLAGALARGEVRHATTLLRTASVLVLVLTTVFAIVAASVAFLLAGSGAWTTTSVAPGEIALAVTAMSVHAVLMAQMHVINSVYRATYRYVRGTLALDLIVPLELAALVTVVAGGGTIAAAALALLLVRSLGLLLYYRDAVRLEPWASIRPALPARAAIDELLHPSLASFALTLSGVFSIHGMTLAVAAVAGPAAVATFGAARVLTRAPLQFSGLVTRATLPELTRAALSHDLLTSRRLHWLGVGSAMLIMVPFFVVMLVMGPVVLAQLSGADIVASPLLLGLLSAAATFNAIWTAASTPLTAQNRQAAFAYWYVLLCTLGLGVAVFVHSFPTLLVTAAAMAVVEALMLGIVVKTTATAQGRAASDVV